MPASIRFIALLEALKGTMVLLAGFGFLGLVHRDLQGLAEELVRHFHLNPASRYPQIFIDTARQLSSASLWLLSCAAFLYAVLRLCEAYGLWFQRRWAEWLGAVSGAIYVPIELYEMLHGVTWPKITLLFVNVICVVCLVKALRIHKKVRVV